MEQLRILFVYQFLTIGGVEVVLRMRLKELIQQGVDARALFLSARGGDNIFDDLKERVEVRSSEADIADFLTQFNPDWVISIDTPSIFSIVRYTLPSTRLVYEVHTSYPAYQAILLNSEVFANVSRIFVPSPSQKKVVEDLLSRPIPVYVVPNALPDSFIEQSVQSLQTNRPVIAWVGRLDVLKNWRAFIGLAQKVQKQADVEFWLVGGEWNSEQERNSLLETIQSAGLDKQFRWLPAVNYVDMPGLYRTVGQSGGCLVSTSWAESFGMTALEAMASGCPVIAPDVTGLCDLIQHSNTGWLYTPGDMDEACAYVIAQLNNKDARETIIANAARKARSFTPVISVRDLLNALDDWSVNDPKSTKANPALSSSDIDLPSSLSNFEDRHLQNTIRALRLQLVDFTTLAQAQIEALNSQNSELQERLDFSAAHIASITQSSSWAITRPFRFLSRIVKSPRQSLLELGVYAWQRLPASTRENLRPLAQRTLSSLHGLVRRIRGQALDLSFKDFRASVLTERHAYKGVFIQERVIDWGVPLYQRPQHMATALGNLGYLVIYKSFGHVDGVYGFRQVAKNVWVTNLDLDDIDDAVFSIYSTSYGLAEDVVAHGVNKNQVFVYEYIDHLSAQISGGDLNVRNLMKLKQFAFKNADYIVASARQLEQEAINAVGRDKVLYIPNGVDVAHYRNPAHNDVVLPENLVAFRKRYPAIVGYFGAIAPWLWYSMLDELAKLRPDVGFVFIGPDYQGGTAHLPQSENVLNLGLVKYQVLPAHARLFDVCMIPFAPGEIARTTSPLKLFEYFALEKPVVVTSFMDECVAYPEVFSGNSAQSLSAAIDAALQVKDDPQFKRRLAALADANSWEERAKAFEKVFPQT